MQAIALLALLAGLLVSATPLPNQLASHHNANHQTNNDKMMGSAHQASNAVDLIERRDRLASNNWMSSNQAEGAARSNDAQGTARTKNFEGTVRANNDQGTARFNNAEAAELDQARTKANAAAEKGSISLQERRVEQPTRQRAHEWMSSEQFQDVNEAADQAANLEIVERNVEGAAAQAQSQTTANQAQNQVNANHAQSQVDANRAMRESRLREMVQNADAA